jgi:hypothetical protein
MRKDSIGLFWEDIPEVKVKKAAAIKRSPPERVWEKPDYLPNLQDAIALIGIEFMTDGELIELAISRPNGQRNELAFDIESYPNYTQVAFSHGPTGKVFDFLNCPDHTPNLGKMRYVLDNFTIFGFNSRNYDIPILAMFMSGCTTEMMYAATVDIIVNEWPWREVMKKWKVKHKQVLQNVDHYDIQEVSPLFASLKIYNGRMHGTLMQDLPVSAGTVLNASQGAIVRYYCFNDLRATHKLANELRDQIDLRIEMGHKYGLDLRSKSDAQIAEAVIAYEIEKETGSRPLPPEIPPGTAYKYEVPSFISFQTPLMQQVMERVRAAWFVVGEHGSIVMPEELQQLQMRIADGVYTMGIGGLHSTEKKQAYRAGMGYKLKDRDVTSFYPRIMTILRLFPDHLGPIFLKIFERILDERVDAKALSSKFKKAGDKVKELFYKVIAASLKIVANGTYGKLGSRFSIIYSPRLLTQVTITGQLSLLMLIEDLELNGIKVISANTDGIVSYPHDTQTELFEAVIKRWEAKTGFTTEETEYTALYSRDVNNYIAFKPDGKFKSKGSFFDPWLQKAEGEQISDECLRKNPQNQICIEAVVKLIRDGIPMSKTIRETTDITRFVTVRTVGGGAVKLWQNEKDDANSSKADVLRSLGWKFSEDVGWCHERVDWIDQASNYYIDEKEALRLSKNLRPVDDVEYLGKAIRWYYAKGTTGEIVAAKSGNKVPKSEGAMPLMRLPDEFPADVDYEWYEAEAEKLLEWIGYA